MEDFKDDEGIYEDGEIENEVVTHPVSCTNVPEALFDVTAAKEHFGKFGNLVKLLLRPKKRSCTIEYETREQAEKAILNAGAYDGFMFNVTRVKRRCRKHLKQNDDPDWVPDADVAAELAAMTGDVVRGPRLNRQQKMEIDKSSPILMPKRGPPKVIPKKKLPPPVVKEPSVVQPAPSRTIDREEIRTLVSRPWPTHDDQLRALEIRDRVLRARLPARRGALRGCCPDMCPERERIMRQVQRQVAIYECAPAEQGSGRMEAARAVKQYSRSSADQEEPLAHDLRPVPVLLDTLAYLLRHIMDLCDNQETSLGDWFHFLWDRLRAIRKDITQQALSCEGSVALVETCARFHAHCAARLVEEPPSSFDQRLNTENLSKCLQSLKYMYGDLRTRGKAEACKREPEFRAYVVLLNMQDSNFMWEVQQLDPAVQSSPEIRFAIQVFTALDNNNYIKFFKLVKETTYLNACILLRYFNDVRARALTRMIKSYSPRGISQFPASELMEMLAFENISSMESFLDHYGLQITSEQDYPLVVLDKNAFCDNSTPYSLERAITLIESKRNCTLGEVVYGGQLPPNNFEKYTPHSSFEGNGYLKKKSVLAEDQGYRQSQETIDEINNIIKSSAVPPTKPKEKNAYSQVPKPTPVFPSREKHPDFTFAKPDPIFVKPPAHVPAALGSFLKSHLTNSSNINSNNLFKTAAENVDKDSIFKMQPSNNVANTENKFVFSKPVMTDPPISTWQNENKVASNLFSKGANDIDSSSSTNNIFGGTPEIHFEFSKPVMREPNPFTVPNVFTRPSIFGDLSQSVNTNNCNNIFKDAAASGNLFQNNTASNIFANAASNPSLLFGNKVAEDEEKRKAEEAAKKIADDMEKELKKQEKIKAEIRKQEELKRKIEQEKRLADVAKEKAERERKEAEKKKKDLEEKIENQLQEIVPEVINEVVDDICRSLMKEEMSKLVEINKLASKVSRELIEEVTEEECTAGITAAMRLYELRLRLLTRRAAYTWRKHVARSRRRRSLLRTTPAWLPARAPPTPPTSITQVLQRMQNFHRQKLPSFKIPVKPKRQAINLFETIKKSLLRRSQEVNKKSFSLNVFWKLVISYPNKNESPVNSIFLEDWISELFIDCEEHRSHLVYLKEHYWYKKFAISICKTSQSDLINKRTSELKALTGMNGLIVYGCTENNGIVKLIKRLDYIISLKCEMDYTPLAIILKTENAECLVSLETQLYQYKIRGNITEYKIYQVTEFNDNILTPLMKEALQWVGRRFAAKPEIESNLLASYLDQCIGSELWFRFKLSLHSSIRTAFQNTESIINLYNEALDKAIQIVCNPELRRFPVFPSELQEFILNDNIFPKEFESFPVDWKEYINTVREILRKFNMPQFTEQWPPPNIEYYQKSMRNFVSKLHWYKEPEMVTLKVFSIINENKADDSKKTDPYSWLDVMNILIAEKIKEETQSIGPNLNSLAHEPLTVVYRKNDLVQFRTTPWWYKSKVTLNITPLLEDYPDDDIAEFGHSVSKKPRLDISNTIDEEMPDELWLSSVMSSLDTSIKQSTDCQKMFVDLEKTLNQELDKQIQLELLLQSAIQNG